MGEHEKPRLPRLPRYYPSHARPGCASVIAPQAWVKKLGPCSTTLAALAAGPLLAAWLARRARR